MLRLLALSALIGVAASLAYDADSLPPESNPNTATDYHKGHERQPTDLVGAFDHPLDALSDAQCDFNAIIAASGNNLVNLVRAAPRRCINGAFSVTGTRARDTCNEADMVKVAKGFFGTASSYNPANPAATPGILNFVQYLRGCLYTQSYNEKDVGKYSNNVVAQIKSGLDVFFNRPNLQAQNGDHYEIFQETLTLVSNAKEYLNYVDKLAQLLMLLSDWKFESSPFILNGYQEDVVNAIYDNIFRSHDETDKAVPYYKAHPEIAKALNDFMNKQANLVGTKNEWILRNTGGELARFLQYTDNYATYSGYVKAQLQKYTPNKGEKVWATIVAKVAYYDNKNWQSYNLCNYKSVLTQNSTQIQTCKDAIGFYTHMGYQLEDCIEETQTKSLFWRIDTPLNWQSARTACKRAGADLAAPENAAQRLVLIDLLTLKYNDGNIWIGLEKQNGTWYYVNGTPVQSYRWSPLYGCSTGANECGYAIIDWLNPSNSEASANSHRLGFFFCQNADCNIYSQFVCQLYY